MKNKSDEFYNRIIDAFYNSEYHISATGFRGVGRNEMAQLIQIIRSDSDNIEKELSNLYKYNPSTIEMDRQWQEDNCDSYDSSCNCFLPNTKKEDYPCTIRRKEYLETTDYRQTPEYKKWREDVFERDEYTCQKCSQVGNKLNAHHIKPYKKYPKERYNIDNGVTLCELCHRDAHRKMKAHKR